MCPVCQGRLAALEGVWVCQDRHSFDRAREGYVNLVLAQHRRSAEAGDPKDSLRHRRRFLEAGYYAPLAAALAELVLQSGPHSLLDVGCGEGYYLRQLALLPDAAVSLYGVDVSKEAIRLAARAAPQIDFAVANTHRLPVVPQSVAAVLQVFSPSAPQQVRRALIDKGLFIEVKPGAAHLQAFRAMIYEQAARHAQAQVPDGFELHHRQSVTFPLELPTGADVAGLIEMTPYKWHMDPDTYARVSALTQLQDTADFAVSVYRKSGAAR